MWMATLSNTFAHDPRTLLNIAPYLRSRSVPPIDVFKRIGLSPTMLLDAAGWVPRDLCFRLANEVEKVTAERFFGASVGRSFKLSDLGPWGLTVSNAPTLRQAFAAAVSGLGLIHKGSDLRFRTEGQRAILSFAFLGRSRFEPSQHIFGTLAVLRSVALQAGCPEAVGVHFSHTYERASEQLEETFGSRLEFGRPRDAIVIDRAILDLPDTRLPERVGHDDPIRTARTLAALLKEHLPYGEVSVEGIAALLRMSTRTLQRRLRDWGFSFEEMIDDIRHAEAMRRVAAGQESMTEVAFLLGYSDPAHFTRAFRRWTGMAPRDYARAGKEPV
jgi:AraC-like DNA-binding protein